MRIPSISVLFFWLSALAQSLVLPVVPNGELVKRGDMTDAERAWRKWGKSKEGTEPPPSGLRPLPKIPSSYRPPSPASPVSPAPIGRHRTAPPPPPPQGPRPRHPPPPQGPPPPPISVNPAPIRPLPKIPHPHAEPK